MAPERRRRAVSAPARARRTAVLGALGVAAHPEQVLGGTTRHDAPRPRRAPRPAAASAASRTGRTGLDGAHPGVLAGAAALHRHHTLLAHRDASEAAGHHMPLAAPSLIANTRSHGSARQHGAVVPSGSQSATAGRPAPCTHRDRPRCDDAARLSATAAARHRSRPRNRGAAHSTDRSPSRPCRTRYPRLASRPHARRTTSVASDGNSRLSAEFAPRNRRQETIERRRLQEAGAQCVGNRARCPARTARSSPGTPSVESWRSSSGSQKSSSSRRRMPCTGCRPCSVFRKTRSSRTVRSLPSTSGMPR